MNGTVEAPIQNPYEPPEADLGTLASEFDSRVWFRAVGVCFYGLLGLCMVYLALHPHSLGPPSALIFRGLASFCGLGAFGEWLQIRARREPAIRACREGVLIRLTRRSEVPEIPSAPDSSLLVLQLLFGRGARLPVARVPWDKIAEIAATRIRGRRALVVQVIADAKKNETFFLVVTQSELVARVRRVAESLNTFFHDPDQRAVLCPWSVARDGEGPSFHI